MKRIREWWRKVRKALDDEMDAHIEQTFGDLLRAAELGEKYERLQRHYPNILARLNAAVERKEESKSIAD